MTPAPAASTLVILGCGFTGREVVRQARDRYARIVATVRDPAGLAPLVALGVEAHALPTLTPDDCAALLPDGADLLIAHPPDGLEAARAARCGHARAIVLVSTTGVYGGARGHVDEETPVDATSPRAAERLVAEAAWRAVGAIVVRPAGIYGPERGLHQRIARGEHRIPGDGSHHVSRIHVVDLAAALLAALDRGRPGSIYCAADEAPVPQIEAIRWLCARLAVPLPPSVPLSEAPETLRGDRQVSGSRLRRELGVTLRFPTYREGFEACLTRAEDMFPPTTTPSCTVEVDGERG